MMYAIYNTKDECWVRLGDLRKIDPSFVGIDIDGVNNVAMPQLTKLPQLNTIILLLDSPNLVINIIQQAMSAGVVDSIHWELRSLGQVVDTNPCSEIPIDIDSNYTGPCRKKACGRYTEAYVRRATSILQGKEQETAKPQSLEMITMPNVSHEYRLGVDVGSPPNTLEE